MRVLYTICVCGMFTSCAELGTMVRDYNRDKLAQTSQRQELVGKLRATPPELVAETESLPAETPVESGD